MPTQYKLEIFRRDFSFRSFSPIHAPYVSMDYLTLEKTTIQVVRASAVKGDYAHITNGAGEVIYQGIVDDVETKKDGTTLTIKPLLAIFDCDVYFDRTNSVNLESFLTGIITEHFIENEDQLQNVPGMLVTATTTTQGRLNLKDNIHSFYEIITKCLTSYGVVVQMLLIPHKKNLLVTVGKIPTTMVIEADLAGIIEKSVIIGDSYGQLNKTTIINRNNESQRISYYLHEDGSISNIKKDRITGRLNKTV